MKFGQTMNTKKVQWEKLKKNTLNKICCFYPLQNFSLQVHDPWKTKKKTNEQKVDVFVQSSNFQTLNYQHSLYHGKVSASKTVKENYWRTAGTIARCPFKDGVRIIGRQRKMNEERQEQSLCFRLIESLRKRVQKRRDQL